MGEPSRRLASTRMLWEILPREFRRRGAVLLGLMLIGMVMETAGVGLILPALALLTQDGLADRYPAAGPVFNALGNPDRMELIVMGAVVLIAVYSAKAAVLAVLVWKRMSFVFGMQAELAQRLFVTYLRQPYTFHLQRNSAELIRNVVTETNMFSQVVLMAGLSGLAEVFVICGIVALMLVLEPVGTLIVSVIVGSAGWAFHRSTRRRLMAWGVARQDHEGLRIQHLQQGLGGAKDAKLLGREEDFAAQFETHNWGAARVGAKQATLVQLPRLGLELLAVIGLSGALLVMAWQGRAPEQLLPTLGLFAVAGFRLMPSANRVMSSFQNVRYGWPAIKVLHEELTLPTEVPRVATSGLLEFHDALTLTDVSFRYPSADRPSLEGASLSIPQGASVGIVGPSGSGKSTLVDVMLGLLVPSSGTVCVDEVDIHTNIRGWQDQIGYVPQTIFLTDDTLRRNVAFGLPEDQIDDRMVDAAVRAAQLGTLVNDLPAGLNTVVGERGVRLSGGQRQRIGIARAIYHNPPVLVLDEATSSLDITTERGVMETVHSLVGERTLIIVAHRMSTVEACDILFRLDEGRVVESGEPARIGGKR